MFLYIDKKSADGLNKKARKRLQWLTINNKPRVKKETPTSYWADLPDLILEQIFSYLSIRDRYNASIVCQRWYNAFYLPYVWSTFELGDSTLVRRKFNYYMGWQVRLACAKETFFF